MSAGAAATAPVSQTAVPAAGPAPVAVDPLAESPDAVWYVRPTSGGQFGPAAGDMMRKWIGEGRINADSLVWREGWAEWRTAGPVFPALSGGPAPPAASAVGIPSSAAALPMATPAATAAVATPDAPPGPVGTPSQTSSTYHLHRRRNSTTLRTAMVVALLVACVALIVVFLAIIAS